MAKHNNRFGLTNKELQIFQMMVNGNDRVTIAETLNMSLETIKTHVWRVNNKTGMDSCVNSILFLIRKRVLSFEFD